MKKKFLALVLTLAMVLSLVPATALATNGTEGGASQENTSDNLTMKKTVTPNEDGTYTVRLESYATGEVTTTTTTKSSDIVLLLDVSGSMGDPYATQETYSLYKGYKNYELKYYSTTHWGLWYKLEDNTYIPVSVGKEDHFGSSNDKYTYSYTKDGKTVIIEKSTGGYTQPTTQFYYKTDANVTKMDALKEAVNAFIDDVAEKSPTSQISIVKFADDKTNNIGNDIYYGTNYTQIVKKLTKVDNAERVNQLKNAVSQLQASGSTASDYGLEKAQEALKSANRDKVVVLFTDGEPNHQNGFDYKVATDAVNTAKTLKEKDTTIYTVGVFKDPSERINKYMSSVSSNYPKASATATNNGKNWAVTNGGSKVGEHYINAENAADLIKAFQTISSQVSSTHLNASAVVVDNVPSNFALNKGSVQVYTADCTGKNEKGELIWSETLDPVNSDITTTIPENKNEDGSQTISTTGFNFSENWCGLDSNNEATGKKLIIEFTISSTNYGGTQPTNAGAYIKAKKADEKPIISLKDPTVPVTISLGSSEELLKKLKVEEEKTYNGSGFAILSEVAKKVNALVNGTNIAKNDYVNMELTVTVEGTTYTYKIRAGETAGKWYEGNREMNADAVSNIKTSPNVKRGEKNAVDSYTYDFNLKLSDKTAGGAEEASYGPYPASFTIKPASVTVKANDQQVQKGTDPNSIPYTATVNGLVNGEQESLISRDIKCNTYTVDTPVTSDGSELEITATGAKEQGNYTVTYRPGKLTVVEAPVTTGILKVTKEVQGENLTLDKLPSDFKITVTGTGESKELSLKDSGVNVNESKTEATWTIPGLDPGEYTVSESNADVTGYDCKATYSATNGATVIVNSSDASTVQNQPTTDAQASQQVTVTEKQTSTMTVTNTYTKKQEVVPTPDTSKPDVNKTATALVNDKTDVTLSVGGKSAKENVAVMFLLDKSTSQGVRDEAAEMLDELATKTNTNIMYDVVIFSGTASSSGWQDIQDSTTLDAIKDNFVGSNPTDGTNMSAGILKAKSDIASLKNTHKEYTETYLITLSDGITYVWSEVDQGKVYCIPVSATGNSDSESSTQNAVDTWDMMYDYGKSLEEVYGGVPQFLSAIQSKITQTKNDSHVQEYPSLQNPIDTYIYDAEKTKETTDKYACGPEAAMYYSITGYEQLAKEFTKTFAYALPELNKKTGEDNVTNWTSFPWGREVMEYCKSISFNKTWDGNVSNTNPGKIFSGIKDVIYYEIQSGSITDVIGADFSLTDQTLTQNTFTLTVNGNAVTANAPSGNVITFGNVNEDGQYPYVLTYYKGTAAKNEDNTYTITSGNKTYTYVPYDTTGEVNGPVSDEFFVLEMNVPVVSLDLKYNLSLTSKRTASGTYEVPTNESATLEYTSANQSDGTVDFNEPTVSYTVKGSSGGHGGNGGGTVTIPDDVPTGLNGKDHYAYVVGYPDGMVYPQKNITRAEVATIFFRLLKDETREANMTKSNGYNDMKDGAWYTCAVSTLSKMGIIKGYEDGSFKPDASISRAEFAAIAARFDPDGDKTPATFSDVSSHWAKDEISIAANHGWIKGYEDGSFKPDQKITRAETMTLVNRVLKRLPETKDDLHKDMKTWPDNQKESAWFYLAVQEATNSHYQKLKKDGTHETWESMRETRDWAALEK